MNRIKSMLLSTILIIISGCAENSELIKAKSASMRSDIFVEQMKGGVAPSGFTDLRITATFKTHKPGMHSSSDLHGTPNYRLLVNIDGQVLLLRGSLQMENSEPVKLIDPEAGDGVRYRFSKNLRLRPGTHSIVIALPDDGIAVEREVLLTEGKMNSLVLEPIYGSKPGMRRPGSYGTSCFTEGISSIRLMLNDQQM